MDLYQELRAIVRALDTAGIPYALCGGVALGLHGHPRFTKDIDLLVRPENLASTKEAMRRLGFTLDSGRLPFAVRTPHEREVHRVSKASGDELLTLDLLLVSPVLEGAWHDRVTFDWDGTAIHAVSVAGLAAMKRLAGRPQDLADIARLEGSGDDPAR